MKPVHIETFCSHKRQECKIGNHTWSVARLIQLSKDLPVMNVPVAHLNLSDYYNRLFLREFVMHMDAVMNADLSKPIILDEDGEIMDGRHRVMKALFKRKNKIKAVRFDVNPKPCSIEE